MPPVSHTQADIEYPISSEVTQRGIGFAKEIVPSYWSWGPMANVKTVSQR